MTDALQLLEKYFDTAFAAPEGIKTLRELILTLAMQGKLVPQDPNDEPASELLKAIEAEKQRLIKEGDIKKSKSLPEIKPEEIPCDLPGNWVWVRLGGVTNYNTRKKVYSEEIDPETWLLDLEDIEKDTSRIVYRAKYIERQSKSTKSIFMKEDVLYGKLRPYLNKVVVADSNGICSTEIVPIEPLCGVNSTFIKWLMKRPFFLSYINTLMYGVKMPRLGTQDALMSLHPLPPIAEQKRIVEEVDRLMVRCDELEKLRSQRDQKRIIVHTAAMNRLLESQDSDRFAESWQFITQHFSDLYSVKQNVTELRKAILQLAVMGKLVPQDPNDEPASELLKAIEVEKQNLINSKHLKRSKKLPDINPNEIPYTVPKRWKWVKFNDVLDVRDGTHDTPKYVDSGYPLITSKNLYTGKLSFENVKYISKSNYLKISERSAVSKGDILFAMIGSIGNPVIVDCDDEFSIKNVALFKFFIANKPINKYLYYFLLKSQEEMTTISSGAVQNFVSLNFLRNYLFPLPPLAEQKRIVEEIDRLMARCDELEKLRSQRDQKQTDLLKAVMAQI